MKKMGRPKGINNMDYVYPIRLDKNTSEKLEKYCEGKNILRSDAIRMAINSMLEKN